jgi:hypothetical protein
VGLRVALNVMLSDENNPEPAPAEGAGSPGQMRVRHTEASDGLCWDAYAAAPHLGA